MSRTDPPKPNRREFLAASAAAAATAALAACEAPPASRPSAAPREVLPEDLAAAALEAAKRAGASYADVRYVVTVGESISTREARVESVRQQESAGLAVRVVARGQFGHAAARVSTADEAAELGRRAVALARSSGGARVDPVELAPTPRVDAEWTSPCEIDPFTIPLDRRAERALAANAAAMSVAGCSFASSGLTFVRERKLFLSSEGSRIRQTVTRGLVTANATAVDRAAGLFEPVGIEEPAEMGFELLDHIAFDAMGKKAAEAAVRRMKARPVVAGEYDLVLLPSHLWLTIHESIGHPTELDRARGLEANYFGTSFLTPEATRKLTIASPKVNIVADRTQPTALATVGYDDDGVAAGRWDLVREGLFVGWQTTREQASWIGEPTSRGCSYAQGWQNIAFQRMPNVSLSPGEERLTLDELVADTKRGILIDGDASYSIDQQRRNFQFTGNAFWAIEDGKVGEPLRDVAYQSNTPQFWSSCDAVCDERAYELHGSFFDGKGQPGQVNPVSHGSAPARFRNVRVLNTRA
ncbi:MAG TPA: TldD/PmbA family protein [Planctomycetota bacterium]|nr:TldD/PmbA family protein [Planctomycetota bacterium]